MLDPRSGGDSPSSNSLLDQLLHAPRPIYLAGLVLGTVIALTPLAIYVVA